MNRKLTCLSALLKREICDFASKIQYLKNKKYYLSQQLTQIKEHMMLIANIRKEQFLYRNNTEHQTSLLEHLQTLQASIYKHRQICCKHLQERQGQLLAIIHRRKIIEKIKNNKYSNTKR
ncbi:hypothetical protein BOKEGFJH_00666 [Chlamydia avium]|uniref:Uncharacterized protein n=2 Tax=Chlamydia avium TaxID=1457141 RepID=W8K0Y0_9CHLA|nr:hypothetical protein [Chlamydia avium]AHK63542.1 Uncharacterized protein M832_06890 [Chlamydia avium 10DC88]EPP36124.1 hypothetical protein CP10743SC13_0031 [Chlamydia psittaci 10_743_SC13]EPP38524.1 hypothetical protein CP10881SC42_0118 [Chlamydia avium]VVT43132.1 hypothetical protein BOKEGFJH_00666 [Chlamydia avium]